MCNKLVMFWEAILADPQGIFILADDSYSLLRLFSSTELQEFQMTKWKAVCQLVTKQQLVEIEPRTLCWNILEQDEKTMLDFGAHFTTVRWLHHKYSSRMHKLSSKNFSFQSWKLIFSEWKLFLKLNQMPKYSIVTWDDK